MNKDRAEREGRGFEEVMLEDCVDGIQIPRFESTCSEVYIDPGI